ncbi:hypothetical protein [Streptomyces sp. NPDC053755]|uniref:hypothetical protein n=1 Tax=Streptomyces sp. NPDC053755 TaxID=3155815 RepID=UPI0034202DF6
MITERQLAALAGCAVDGEGGRHVGDVEYFLLDDTTGKPEWARIIDRGTGPRDAFVPLRGAEPRDGRLAVPYPLALIERAPRVTPERDGVLTVAEEERLIAHYGLRNAREETNTQAGAGWAEMDRAQAIREGTDGHEGSRSRLRRHSAGSA